MPLATSLNSLLVPAVTSLWWYLHNVIVSPLFMKSCIDQAPEVSPQRGITSNYFKGSFLNLLQCFDTLFKMQIPKLDSFQCLFLWCFMQRENCLPTPTFTPLEHLKGSSILFGPLFPRSTAQFLPTPTPKPCPVCRVNHKLLSSAPEWSAVLITWSRIFALSLLKHVLFWLSLSCLVLNRLHTQWECCVSLHGIPSKNLLRRWLFTWSFPHINMNHVCLAGHFP